jgi:SAM-dependent methyltransferase
VTEWRLFEKGTIPYFSTDEFFATHPWIEPAHQIGHAERMEMVADAFRDLISNAHVTSVLDLGCGDGSLLRMIRENVAPGAKLRGITRSPDDAMHALAYGLDVEVGNFLTSVIQWEEVTIMTEVLEHLYDPHGFLARIESKYLIASSPSAETSDWHYEHHTWAWDLVGYLDLIEDAGWHILDQRECSSAASYDHGTGLFQPLRFQAVTAVRQ